MHFSRDGLNRSLSESDLYIAKFDNLSVSSPEKFDKGFTGNQVNFNTSVVRRIYIEEIFPSFEMRRSQIGKLTGDMSSASPLSRRKVQYSGCEEVPMDIDTSYHDERLPKMMGTGKIKSPLKDPIGVLDDGDREQKTCLQQPGGRTRVIRIKPSRKSGNKYKWWLFFLLILFLSIILSFFPFNYSWIFTRIFINFENQIENLKTDLNNNVHGQKSVVDSIVNSLENREQWADKLKVLSFVGSQGVGKTFVASLIKKHFLVHDIYGSQLSYPAKKQEIIDDISSFNLNLIILDDLKQNDSIDLYAFVHSLPKEAFILLIPIFNIHYKDESMNTVVKHNDIIKIRDDFDTSGIKDYELLVFEDFTSEQIKDWVKKQLHLNNISHSDENRILQNVLDSHDIKHGLKGLHSKMNLEFEKYKN